MEMTVGKELGGTVDSPHTLISAWFMAYSHKSDLVVFDGLDYVVLKRGYGRSVDEHRI